MATTDPKDIALLIGPDPQHLTDAMLYAMRPPPLFVGIDLARKSDLTVAWVTPGEAAERVSAINLSCIKWVVSEKIDRRKFKRFRQVGITRALRPSRGWRRHVRRMKARAGK